MKLVSFVPEGGVPRAGALVEDGRAVVDLGAAHQLSLIGAGTLSRWTEEFSASPAGRARRWAGFWRGQPDVPRC